MKTSGKTFSCPWLLIHRLFNKKLYHWETDAMRNYVIDVKHCMENFDTTDLHTLLKRVSWFNKPDCQYGPRGFFQSVRYELRMTTGCKKVQNGTQVLGSFFSVNGF